MRFVSLLAATIALALPATAEAACAVVPFTLTDQSRSVALPYASPADPGAQSYTIHGLAWQPVSQSTTDAPAYRALFGDPLSETEATQQLQAALLFYGVRSSPEAMTAALSAKSSCALAKTIDAAPRGGVIIAGTLPPVFYGGLGAALAAKGIPTVAVGANDADLRLVLNHLIAERGWPAERIVLVGHGHGAAAAALTAMTRGGIRALVSLDGFEALDPARHPGLSANAGWRPGHLRTPVLHLQPRDRPHADTGFYDRAERSAYTRVEIADLPASQWATAVQIAPAPEPLATLMDAELAGAVTTLLGDYIAARLGDGAAPAPAMPSSRFTASSRPALATPALLLDVKLDEPVWKDARTPASTGGLALRIAEDCDYVYVAIVPDAPTPFASDLYFDADGSGGENWTAPDLLLHSSNSLCKVTGTPTLESRHCQAADAWWGASRTVRPQDRNVVEYYVAKKNLGLARCAPAAGMAIAGSISLDGSRPIVPAGADPARPSSWAKIGGQAARSIR